MMNFGMMGGDHMMGWGGMFFGPLMMIAFLGLIVFAVVMMVKWIDSDHRYQNFNDQSLNILRERFAAGEIDIREYEERRTIISG